MAALPPLPTRQKRRYGAKSQTSADVDSFLFAAELARQIEDGSDPNRRTRTEATPPRTVPRGSISNDISVASINYPRVARSPSSGSLTGKWDSLTGKRDSLTGKRDSLPDKRTSNGISGIMKLIDKQVTDNRGGAVVRSGSVGAPTNVYASIRSTLRSSSKLQESVVKSKPEVVETLVATKIAEKIIEQSPVNSSLKKEVITSNKISALVNKMENPSQTSLLQKRAASAKSVEDKVQAEKIAISKPVSGSQTDTIAAKNVGKSYKVTNSFGATSENAVKSEVKPAKVAADDVVVIEKKTEAVTDLRFLVNKNSTRNTKLYKNRSITNPDLNSVTTGKLRLEATLSRSVDPLLIECCKHSDYFKLISLIEERGASVVVDKYLNIFDDVGKTPLLYAVLNNDVMIVKELCKLPGLDVNLQDLDGNSSLHLAAQGGYGEVLNLLTMVSGVEIDKKNYAGMTPLMKAALQGKSRCVRILLVAGASLELRDPKKNFGAYDWSVYCGRKACAEMILRYLESSSKTASKSKWSSEPDLKSSKLTKSLSFVGKVWKNVTGGKTDPTPVALKRQLSVSAELTKIGLAASMTSLPDVVPREVTSMRPKMIIPRVEISFWSPNMVMAIPPPPSRAPPKLANEAKPASSSEEKKTRKTHSNPPLYAVRSKGVLEVKFPVVLNQT